MKRNNRTKYICVLLFFLLLLQLIGSFYWKFDVFETVLVNIFVAISGFEIIHYKNHQGILGFFSGHNVFLFFWTMWLFFAWWGKYYYVAHEIWYARNASIHFTKFLVLNIFALLIWTAFYLIGAKTKIISKKKIKLKLGIFNDKELKPEIVGKSNKIVSFIILACVIISTAFYLKIGGVTIFYLGDVDQYRFQVQEMSSFFNYVSYALPLLVIIKAYFCMIRKLIKISDVIFIVLALVFSAFYGAKMLVLFPIITIVLLYYYIYPSKDFLNVKTITLAAVCVIGATIFTNMRGLGQAISDGLIADILLFVGGEFRDATRFVTLIDEDNLIIPTFMNTLSRLIPSEIRTWLGLDIYDASIGMSIKQMLGYTYTGGSTRVGILAEMYMSGRWLGIFIAFAVLGIVMSKVDKALIDSKDRHFTWRQPFLYMLVFQLTWFLVAETYIQLPALVIYVILFIILEFAVELLTQKNKNKIGE